MCCALEFASEELKADREVVLPAVRQNRTALMFTSEELRGDEQVMMAVGKYGALQLVAEMLANI